jgi:hypothetical protein
MKTINPECKPFGLCSEEVKEELRPYVGTEAMEIYHNGWQFKEEPFFNNSATYRVQIPDEPKKIPLSQEEWLRVGRVFVSAGWRNVEVVGMLDVSLSGVRCRFEYAELMDHKAVDALGNPIKLYKFEGES